MIAQGALAFVPPNNGSQDYAAEGRERLSIYTSAGQEEFRMTDGELKQKFRDNASRLLGVGKINKTLEMMFELEKLENTAELMELVA